MAAASRSLWRRKPKITPIMMERESRLGGEREPRHPASGWRRGLHA